MHTVRCNEPLVQAGSQRSNLWHHSSSFPIPATIPSIPVHLPSFPCPRGAVLRTTSPGQRGGTGLRLCPPPTALHAAYSSSSLLKREQNIIYSLILSHHPGARN